MTTPAHLPINAFGRFFEMQWLHWLALLALLAGAHSAAGFFDGFSSGSLWGKGTRAWFWLGVQLAIAHQVYVWLCWRVQLHGRWLQRLLGQAAFGAYALVYAILALARWGLVLVVAIAGQGTLQVNATVLKVLAVLALLPAAYTVWSVWRHVGIARAMGQDHFDDSYRQRPFVTQGIYRYTRNGMYVYGLLLPWAVALWWTSEAALWLALFNHLYVWVHYFSTEWPDIRTIYGDDRAVSATGSGRGVF